MATIYGARGTSGQTNVRARQRQEGTRPPCRQQSPDYAPVSSITVRRRLMATNVGLRPTPRLGRLRGPQRPAPLPRRRARPRAARYAAPVCRRAWQLSSWRNEYEILVSRRIADQRGAPPHTPARSLAGTVTPRAAPSQARVSARSPLRRSVRRAVAAE